MEKISQHFAGKHIGKSSQTTAKQKLAKELACEVAPNDERAR
jgi:hypothetical protein